MHFGLPALPFALGILFFDEIRKGLISYSCKGVKGDDMPGWWARNAAWWDTLEYYLLLLHLFFWIDYLMYDRLYDTKFNLNVIS